MAYIVMAYIVMVYIVMAKLCTWWGVTVDYNRLTLPTWTSRRCVVMPCVVMASQLDEPTLYK